MKSTESVKEYFARIVEGLRTNGEILEEVKIVKKILESLSLKFHTKKTIIESTQDLNFVRLDDLEDELVTYEMSLNQKGVEILEETLQTKYDQSKEKEELLNLAEINEDDQNSEIVEKIREGKVNFYCGIDVFDWKEDFNIVQTDLSIIFEMIENDNLVETNALSIEASILSHETCNRRDWSLQGEDIEKEIPTVVVQEKLFESIQEEANNERSKSVHQEQDFDDVPKIEAKTIKGLDSQLKCMIVDVEDTINFEPLFDIMDFEEYEKLFVGDTTLPHTKRKIEVEWARKPKYKPIGEATDFEERIIIHGYKKRRKYDGDNLKMFDMKKVKLILDRVEEKLKITKDGTHNFVDATYFKKLMESLRYMTSTRHDIVHGMLKFEDLGLREAMLELNQDSIPNLSRI